MSVLVLRVSGMPCNVDIWVDDDPAYFAVYIDESLITERGAASLQALLRSHRPRWQRLDESTVYHALRAITG